MGAVSIILLAGLFYVLKMSFANPVEMASDYQMSYQEVDKNYDKIVALQKIFDSSYTAEITSSKDFKLNGNCVTLQINKTDKSPANDINVTALVTRPDTSKLDIKLSKFQVQNGVYTSEQFNLPKEGRWQVNFKLQSADGVKHFKFEGFAKPSN